MRIAIIGSGIAGLVCAWKLGRDHDVTLYEANDYLGGHTHTHTVEQDGRSYAVDSGFIVHNPLNYPHFTALLDELGVASQPTTMSFSVHKQADGLAYNATSLDTLFCQRRNLLSPRFLGMVRDIMRFYRESPALLRAPEPGPALGEYLAQNRYGEAFRSDHLIPMASALWSSPASRILEFPARYLVQFMANHQMLRISGRPQWRVVQGGSRRYIDAMRQRWTVRERLNCAVRAVRRQPVGVQVITRDGQEHHDEVIFACHSDQALALLADATPQERQVLGAIAYQDNDVVLHTDARLLPRQRKAWAAWNAYVPADPQAPCSVSYCMNLLQGIASPRPFIVTLNRGDAIDPAQVLARMRYHHPVYTHEAVAAQARRAEISGRRRTWYVGAYWGWGFHEDGVASALDVVRAMLGRPRVWAREAA
ncbi:NAD(P)/FAD-dependent oxidoreductase [Achromobacter ruhlandii]|uniref:Amine oxidase domain-containing protein n=1 Tax=Achromobacter ruhlandii TaxID=72557 RepID=A0ABM8LYB8_9BURK|nr:FAD-dependent oxidoreductase [Achromobacter ruhlandii]AKP91924.1 Amine oxidase, flavin-containing [Achromobacter xylosoxidans]AOU95162.1 flavin-containing amine oxidase [Achromobacter ruhlandii]MCZ8431460.1 FAD-dependent oxidoreductase [Achromobacter ruhlandii]MDC6149678.1 FAD-dependent oxidoreductase [Achromobacter ruhlandii]MDD7981871.1 FAD-dependent oxidoreductase [Achromobacter ruhlandii]